MGSGASFGDDARRAAALIDADVYVYNGALRPRVDLSFITVVDANVHREQALLVLTTNGGDPDAAYRIARYMQDRYATWSVLVAGRCKSAGTLLALGATELVFSPYGELGPLDIQLSKVDRFDQLQSGLTIQDSLNTLEERAIERYHELVRGFMLANDGLLSFGSATSAACDMVAKMYAPVFARIDPEEVGARVRSMRIASDYGKRLNARSGNLKDETLRILAETYPSHSFVIDRQEAETLFHNVRRASASELDLVDKLGVAAGFDLSPGGEIRFDALSGRSVESVADAATEKEPSHVEIKPGRDTQSDVADHPRAGRASDAQASFTQRPSGADGSSDPQAAVPVAANG